MVLIKLSAHHKITIRVMAILLITLLLVFTMGAAPSCATPVQNEPNRPAETPTCQSYETETRDECDEISGTADNSDGEEDAVENTYVQHYTEQDAIDIAKVLYRECRGVPSKTEKSCVAWTILNRVDLYDSPIHEVVRADSQFAFCENTPIWDELLELAYDVLERWNREKNGEVSVGRTLPKEYVYFYGKNGRNYFRDNYEGGYQIWDYVLDSPYERDDDV